LPMAPTLRQTENDDIAEIFRVRYAVRENTLPPGVISDEDVRRAIEDTGRGWVVEAEGQVVAFAIGNAVDGNIWALFVHPDGRRLHAEMTQWLWSQSLQTLWLTTGPGTRARGFYERLGWWNVGRTAKGELRFELHRT
jgi:GNAT superfamily N-acetyltransferase